MDKYEALITIFSEILNRSKDYHIAYIHYIGYVSVIGLYDEEKISTLRIDEIFSSPREMADSLMRNWRWQWFYKNRKLLVCKDYCDIYELDNDIPDLLRENYCCSIKELHNKIRIALQEEY